MIVGCLFAGGRGRRLGGRDKALITLGEAPLWRIAEDKLTPLVDVLIVTGPTSPNWASPQSGFHFVSDVKIDGEAIGPAGGLLAGLRYAEDRYGSDGILLTLPVDMPFVTAATLKRLIDEVERGKPAVVAADTTHTHPTLAGWRAQCLEEIEQAVSDGVRALRRLMRITKAEELQFANTEDEFLNINTEEDLDRARMKFATD